MGKQCADMQIVHVHKKYCPKQGPFLDRETPSYLTYHVRQTTATIYTIYTRQLVIHTHSNI